MSQYIQVAITSNFEEDGRVTKWVEAERFEEETSTMQYQGNGLYVDGNPDGDVTWYVQVIGQRR